MTESPAHQDQDNNGSQRSGRRSLPFGPLGLLIVTFIALAGAFGVAWLFLDANTEDTPDARTVFDEESSGIAGIGDPLPSIELDYIDGDTANLRDLQGTPTVINFWASTCPPCLAEMPDLEQVSQDLSPEVQFLGVDVQDTEEDGRKMIERTGVTYPNARDPQAEIMSALGGTALPRTILVNSEGVIVESHNGAITAEDLTDLINDSGMVSR